MSNDYLFFLSFIRGFVFQITLRLNYPINDGDRYFRFLLTSMHDGSSTMGRLLPWVKVATFSKTVKYEC